jgi:acetolactate synthase-1/2/3 large subunit
MKWGERPVIIIGHGIRATGADPAPLLGLGVPVLSSWQAADLVDNYHPRYFGRPGIYGQRCANRILYEADQIVAIGCRLTPWMIGHAGLRSEQELCMVDVDGHEVARFPQAKWIGSDAKEFIPTLESAHRWLWLAECEQWRNSHPWVEPGTHDDTEGFINSYRFIQRLEPLLRRDEIICVDVGSLMCPVFQALHVAPPQRLITSGGLGEMGCGLPAAIGASFARSKGQVLCMVGDGGAMMNLQELQTIVHHQLPVKIIVFANDGYAMIKGTHRNIGIPYTGVSRASGVSMPRFQQIAFAFGIQAGLVRSWEHFDSAMPQFLAHEGPALLEVFIDPEQQYVPRLQPIKNADGTFSPARFCDLSP